MHESSYRIMTGFVNKYIATKKECTVLDIGSQLIDGQQGLGSYKNLFTDMPGVSYKGLDMVEGLNVDVVLQSPYNWSNVQANLADFVISGQMLEHVEFPWLTFIEINRVLKPGGVCCIIAPSSGIMHNFPLDCYRYYPDGMAALAAYASLEIIECYAEWEADKYPGRDPEWRDCVVIARKRPNTLVRRVKNTIKRWAVHTVSKACLDKKDFKSRNPVLDTGRYSISKAEIDEAPKMYFDTGKGFNENETMRFPSGSKIDKKVVFPLTGGVLKRVRFDPCEKPCLIRNIKFIAGNDELKPCLCNGKRIRGGGYGICI
ncbi:MAG: class I SAM-dependent methyltransferase [Oscillospiraceae bacterium]|nr:class I SAM-dependent methyltransferase [Oscillospiraceae bacterium]